MATPSAPPRSGAGPKAGPDTDPFRIVVTGLDSNVEQFAREAAYEKLNKSPDGPAWKRVLKSAWQNMSHDYQYIKAKEEARQEIEESGNLLHHHGLSDESWREAAVARQGSDFAEELIREEAGEKLKRINAAEAVADPNAARMRDDVVGLLGRYARGEFADDDSFQAEWDRTRQGWEEDKISQDFIGEGKFLGTNVLRGAKELKGIMDGITGLDKVDAEMQVNDMLANMELVTGESKLGSQVEIEDSLAERLASKMQNSKFLSESRLGKITSVVGNETFVAATLAAATYGATRAASMAATGLGGGLAAGLRERRALKVERALAQRRRYMGDEATATPDDSNQSVARRLLKKTTGLGETEEERRAEIDATLASGEKYEDVMASLNNLYDDTGELKITDAAQLTEAMKAFAEAQARSKRVGMVDYQNIAAEETMDAEFQLIVALSKVETDLKKLYDDGKLGTKPDEFSSTYDTLLSAANGAIDIEISESDRLWRKLEKARILKKTVLGGTIGASVGAAVHGLEGWVSGGTAAAATGAPSDLGGHSGGPTNLGGSPHAPTDLGGETHGPTDLGGATHGPENLGSVSDAPSDLGGSNGPENLGGDASPSPSATHGPENLGGGKTGAPTELGGNGGATHTPEQLGGAGATSTPEDLGGLDETTSHELSDHSNITMPEGYKAEVSDNTLTVTTPDGKSISGLELNKDGSLTSAAQDTLRDNGLKLSDHVTISQGEATTSHVTVSGKEFAENHKSEMTKIGHREWIKNADELKMQNHANADGSVTIDISGMSNPAWKEAAADGHMNIYVSASSGSSSHGFKIPVGPDGKAHVSADSPARALFGKDGHPVGGYQEASITRGVTDGADNISILSTAVGDNKDSLVDAITSKEPTANHAYTLFSGKDINATNTFFSSPLGSAAAQFGVPVVTPTGLLGRTRLGKAEKVTPIATPAGPSTPSAASAGSATSATGGPASGSSGPKPTPPAGGPAPGAGPGTGPTGPKGPDSKTGPTDTFTDGERAVLNALDTQPLDVPEAFTFSGRESYSERSQKMAMQLIDIARVDLGDDADPAALAARAAEMAESYRTISSPDMAKIYADTAAFLSEAVLFADEAATTAAAAADTETETAEERTVREKRERAQRLLDDLDAEELKIIPGYGVDDLSSFDQRAVKQAMRTLLSVDATTLKVTPKEGILDKAISVMNVSIRSSSDVPALNELYTNALGVLQHMKNEYESTTARASSSTSTAGPEAKTSADGDKKFFDELDKEELDTPYGFDFSGYLALGDRERKQAVRFIREAINEMGGDSDKVAVVNSAIAKLNTAAAKDGLSDQMKALYADALGVLNGSKARVEKDAETNKGGASLLDNLDAESREFPFASAFNHAGMTPGEYSVDSRRLMVRVYNKVMDDGLGSWPRRPKAPVDPGPFASAEVQAQYVTDRDEYTAEKKAYNKYVRSFMSAALRAIAEAERSLGTTPTDAQRAMISDANSMISRVREIYSIK